MANKDAESELASRDVTAPFLASLSNHDGDGYENVGNVGNFFWSWILKDCIRVQEKKKKVVAVFVHVLHKTWN